MTALELKEARISLGLSQQKLAIELGVARNTVRRWEAGKHKVPRMLDLALKELAREHGRRRRSADLRKKAKRQKVQATDVRPANGAVESKSKPARMVFMARGNMGPQGIEFSSAAVALVVPQNKVSRNHESNRVNKSQVVRSTEDVDGKKTAE